MGYVAALNAHDVVVARRYLAPERQQEMAGEIPPFDDWVANVVSARLRSLPPGIPDTDRQDQEQPPGYRDLVEFGVTYDAVFRTESEFATSGPQTRFFIVGHSRSQDAWFILGIDTGP